MNTHKLIGVVSGGIIACSVVAQIVPICCRYLYEWPEDMQGPSGACSGSLAVVCEDSSDIAQGDDPMAFILKIGVRPAQCCVYTLSSSGSFIRASCSTPPVPGATRIGQLPDGTCCWISQIGPIDKDCWDEPYDVLECDRDCPDVPA